MVVVVEEVINQVVVLNVVVKAVSEVGRQCGASCCTQTALLKNKRVALTLMTTVTGDGDVPHLEEETCNSELELVDVLFLLLVVIVVIQSSCCHLSFPLFFSMLLSQLSWMNLLFSTFLVTLLLTFLPNWPVSM